MTFLRMQLRWLFLLLVAPAMARHLKQPMVMESRAGAGGGIGMAYVKSNPGKVTFGSSGNYGTMHVPM